MKTLYAAAGALLLSATVGAQGPQVRTVEDRQHVTVMEFGGVYDRQPEANRAAETAARKAIAREFLRTHADDYDFLVVLSRFDFDLGTDSEGAAVQGLYRPIRNDVSGIGIEPFDFSAEYGSGGALQGYIDLGVLSRLPQDQTDPRFEQTLTTLMHEMLHRWGAQVHFRDTDGTASEQLLGRDKTHWNFLLQTYNSVHYGHDWRDNGDGTFTSVGRSGTFYSPLDLYLMGMLDRTQVPPFFVIENQQVVPTRTPEVGVTVTGTKKWITIDDVIAAEGERVPAAGNTQTRFKVGFLFLVRPGEQANGAELATINALRDAFSTRFIILTGGKGLVQVYPEQREQAPEAPAPVTPPSGPRTTPVDLVQALDWILSRQTVSGSWEDSVSTRVRDTAAVLDLLREVPAALTSHQRGLGWLTRLDEYLNVDMVSRRLLAIAPQFSATDSAFLATSRNASGGWGLREGYLSDPFDTALALLARPDGGQAANDIDFLLAAQNSDGGWAVRPGGASSVQGTLAVLRLGARYSANTRLNSAIARGVAWLGARQHADGGFGDEASTVYETADAVLYLLHTDFSKTAIALSLDYLRRRQLGDGSWNGSAFQTALATRALKVGELPNVAAVPGGLTISPASPVDGQLVTIRGMVMNDGVGDVQNVRVSLFDGDPAAGGTPIGSDIILPSLPALTQLPVTFTWDTSARAGARTLFMVVDGLGELNEFNEADNVVSAPLVVREPPLEAELSVQQGEITFVPARLQSVPQAQAVSARISNAGRTPAESVIVWLYEGDPAAGQRIGETTVSVAARSSAIASFSFTVAIPGEKRYTVVVDPANAVAEADETNNQAFNTLAVQGTIDFVVTPGSLVLSSNPIAPGQDLQVNARVANTGTTDTFNVPVRIFVDDPAGVIDIGTRIVDLPAGGSVPIAIQWRTGRALSGVPLVVHVDPANAFPESSDVNNTLSVPLTVTASTEPNLHVSPAQLQVAAPVNQGAATPIAVQVRNDGATGASNVAVAFFIGVPGSGGVQVGATATVAQIGPGTSTLVSVSWTPADAGDKLVYVVVDPDNAIAEFDEADNTAFVTAHVLSRPDLAITAGAIAFTPAFPKQGDPVVAVARIVNTGEQPASARVRFFDGLPSAGVQLGTDQVIQLAGHGQGTVQVAFAAGNAAARALYVVVDPMNAVDEQDENNNVAFRTLGVQDSSLWLSNLYFSPNGDGRQDTTELFFRFEAPQEIGELAVYDRKRRKVRSIPVASGAIVSGSGTWDGRDDAGRVVADGPYDVALVSGSGAELGVARVVLDTNNLPVNEAAGSKFLLQTNLSAALPPPATGYGFVAGFGTVGWLPDDSGMVRYFASAALPDPAGVRYTDIQPGVYITSADGESNVRITPDAWTIHPPSGPGTSLIDVKLSPDGQKVLIQLQKYEGSYFSWCCWYPAMQGPVEFWVINVDGSGLRKIGETPVDASIDAPYYYWIQTKWSPASDQVALETRAPSNAESRLYIMQADGSGQSMALQLPRSSSFYDFDWSPDGSRFLYIALEGFAPTGYAYRMYAAQRDGASPQVVLTSVDDLDWLGLLRWVSNDRFVFTTSMALNAGGYFDWGNHAFTPYLVTLAGGRPTPIGNASEDLWDLPVNSPDGSQIAFISNIAGQPGHKISVAGADGVARVVYGGTGAGSGGIQSLHWSADGQRVAWSESLILSERVCGNGPDGPEICREISTLAGYADLKDGTTSVFEAAKPGESFDVVGLFPDGNAYLFTKGASLWAVSLADGVRTRLLQDTNGHYYDGTFSPSGKYFVTSDVALSSLLNLTAQFGFRRDRDQLAIRGTAEDANFLGYRLEYAPVAAPADWSPIGASSEVSVINGLLADWIPPAEGSFYVRLTAEDKAGNVRSTRRRITWGLTPSITNVTVAPRLFSPNGDGTRDTVAIDYSVLGPVNLSFEFTDAAGAVVRSIAQSHTELGPASIAWDGRNEQGQFVPDGVYAVRVLGYQFFVTVDTTPPTVSIALGSGFHLVDRKVTCVNRDVAQSCTAMDGPFVETPYFTLDGSVQDSQLARWVLESGSGVNPAEWQVVGEGTEVRSAGNPFASFTSVADVAGKRYRLTAFDQAGNRATFVSAVVAPELILHASSGQPIATTRPVTQRIGPNTLSVLHTSREPMQWMNVEYRLRGTLTWLSGGTTLTPPAATDLPWDSSALTGGLVYEVRVAGTDANGAVLVSNVITVQAEEFRFVGFHTGLKSAVGLITLAEPVISMKLVAAADVDITGLSNWNTSSVEFRISPANDPNLPPCGGRQVTARFKAVGVSGRIYYSNEGTVVRSAPPSMVPCGGGEPDIPRSVKLEIAPELAPACGAPAPGAVGITMSVFGFEGVSHLFAQDVPNGPLKELPGRSARILTSAMPEGRYAVRATVGAADGGSIDATGEFFVDRVAPVAQLTYPVANQSFCPVKVGTRLLVPIEGIAEDPNFRSYQVELGLGDSPLNWIPVPSVPSDRPARQSPPRGVLANLDVTDLAPGTYTVRLRVYDEGGNLTCSSVTFYFPGAAKARNLRADLRLISPNLDGVKDASSIAYELDAAAAMTARVYPVVNGVRSPASVRTVFANATQLAGANTFSWDGRGDGGSVVPDGTYDVVIAGADACGNATDAFLTIVVDATAPDAVIASPQPGGPTPLLIEVRGTAADVHFQQFALDVSDASTAGGWRRLASGPAPVRDALLGTWDTKGIADTYTLRLTAADAAGNTRETVTSIVVTDPGGLVTGLTAEPAIFSPNRDGRLDRAAIDYHVGSDARLRLEIVDASDAVVKLLSESEALTGSAFAFAWDGTNSAGQVVPDGTYYVRLAATAKTDPTHTQTERRALVVDTTAPVLDAVTPLDAAHLRGAVAISGTASDPHIDRYTVSYASAGSTPTALDEGRQSRTDYTFGQISGVPDGLYSLSMQAADLAGNPAEKVIAFTVDNTPPLAVLASPIAGAIVGGDALQVTGTAQDAHISRWTLRAGPGADPAAWTELATGSTSLTAGSSLMMLDPASLPDGVHTLSLTVTDRAGSIAEARASITIDRTPPVARITLPVELDWIGYPVDVIGDATDANFKSAVLEVSEGTAATAARFVPLTRLQAGVTGGSLFRWSALPPNGTYTLRLTVEDAVGLTSEARRTVTVDTEPPAAPAGLTATLENRRNVRLTWGPVTGTVLARYDVYRGATRIGFTPDAGYLDENLADGQYIYTVRAVADSDLVSVPSNEVKIRVDLTGPRARISTPANGGVVSGLLDLLGTASSDDFKEYRVLVGLGAAPAAFTLIRQSPAEVVAGSLADYDVTSIAQGTSVTIRLEAEDLSGNVSEHQVTVTVDNLAPAAPVLVSGTATGSNVAIAWQANTEPDLAGYLLYNTDVLANARRIVNGSLAPFILKGTTFTDVALPDGQYKYFAFAIDTAGNQSAQSNTLTVAVETRAPHASIVQPANNSRVEHSLQLIATTPDRDIARVQFQVRPAAGVWEDLGAPLTREPYQVTWDPASLPYGDYQFQAIATDQNGNTDPAPTVITIVLQDLTPPPVPAGISARVTGDAVALTWPAVAASDLAGYKVYRRLDSGAAIAVNAVPVSATTLSDSAVPDGRYVYIVQAVDTSANESAPSPGANVRVYAPVIAAPPLCLSAETVALSGTGAEPGATVTILRDPATGPTEVATAVAGADGSFQVTGVALVVGANVFAARAADAAGNVSRLSAAVTVTRSEPAPAPSGFTATVNGFDVSLSWDPDAVVTGYALTRNGVSLNPVVNATAGAWASASSASRSEYNAIDGNGGSYWFPSSSDPAPWLELNLPAPVQLVRIDIDWSQNFYPSRTTQVQSWNGSAWVSLASLQNDGQIWSNVITLQAPVTTSKIRVLIESRLDWDSGIAELRVFSSAPITGTTFTDPALTDGRYTYALAGLNACGVAGATSEARADVGDVTAPPAPADVVAAVAGSDVTLSWTASADAAGYHVYEFVAGQWTKLNAAIATATAFAQAQVPNGVHVYRVTAVDAVGNESLPSASAQAVVDVPLAAAPASLTVFAPPTGGALELAWQPVPGVDGYRLFRSELAGGPYVQTPAANISGTTYRDTAVVDGTTYYYVVRGVDAAANLGAASNEASAMAKDSTTPAAPVLLSPTLPGQPITVASDTVVIGGRAEPGSLVTLLDDGLPIAEANASATAGIDAIPLGNSGVTPAFYRPDGIAATFTHWAPTNQWVFTLVDVATGSQRQFPQVMDGSAPSFSPDGRTIAIGRGSSILLFDRATEQVTRTITLPHTADYASYSPDGLRLAYIVGRYPNYQLWVLDIATATPRMVRSGGYIGSATWMPGGDRIAIGAYPSWTDFSAYYLQLVDVATGALTVVDNHFVGYQISFSPDGTRMAFTSTRNVREEIWVYDIGAGTSSPLVADTVPRRDGAYSPDGQKIAYVASQNGRELRVRTLATADDVLVLAAPPNGAPAWTRDGSPILVNYNAISRIRAAGAFTFDGVFLAAPRNVFSAIAEDAAGNVSAPADPIEIRRQPQAVPDLAIGNAGVLAYPNLPIAGEPVRLSAEVRNDGDTAAGSFTVGFFLRDATGRLNPIGTPRQVASLAAGGRATVTIDWATAGTIGAQTIVAWADPANTLAEASDDNNSGQTSVMVAADASPSLSVATDRPSYAPSASVTARVMVVNAGAPADFLFELRIEDAGGNRVATLATENLPAFGYATRSFQGTWVPSTVLAGNYRARAVLSRVAGGEQSASAAFVVLGDRRLTASLTTDRASYQVGDTVNLSGILRNASGNEDLGPLAVLSRITDGGSADVFRADTNIGLLLIGSQAELPSQWIASAPGTYTASLGVQGDGAPLAQSSVTFTVAGVARLQARVSTTPAPVGYGEPFRIAVAITNTGTAPVLGAVLRVHVLDPDTQEPLRAFERPLDLMAGASLPWEVSGSAAGLSLRNYGVVLRIEEAGVMRSIASGNLSIVDVRAPALVLASPAIDALFGSDVTLTAVATDDASGVERVEFSVDGGAWTRMAAADAATGRYTATLPVGTGLAEGRHLVSIRATDAAGNGEQASSADANPVGGAFIVDLTPPVIAVSGVADGVTYDGPVTPVISVTDAHAVTYTATVNGAPFTSGTVVSGTGDFVLGITAVDAAGNISARSLTFSIGSPPPIARAGIDQVADEGATVTLDGSASSSANGQPLSFAWRQLAGTAVVLDLSNPSRPTLVAPPVPRAGGALVFELVVTAGAQASAPATVSITVRNVNRPPVAEGRAVTTAEDTALPITLTGTDSDDDESVLSFSVVTPPAHGQLTGTGAALTYTPAPDFNGADSFTFMVSDGLASSAPASVTISVTPVNDPPVADAGTGRVVDQGTRVVLDGSLSRDADGDSLTYTWTQIAGTAVVLDLADGARPAFVAPDAPRDGETLTFRLVVGDGSAASGPAVVNVRVNDVNRAPVASAGAAQTVRGGALVTLDGRASSDADGDPVTYLWRQVAGPAVELLAPTSPAPTFTAPAVSPAGETLTFELTVSDGLESNSARTDVRVEGDNPPTADAGPDQVVDEDGAVTLDGTASSSPDGHSLSFAWRQLSGAAVVLDLSNPARPSFVAPPVPRAGDTLLFELVVTSGTQSSAPATVRIVVRNVNRPPAADGQTVSTAEDTAIAIALTATDPDDDVSLLSFTVVDQPAHGQLSGTGAALTYTPDPDYNGADSFTFTASDGLDVSAPATVTISVTPVNDPPVADAGMDRVVDQGTRVVLDGSLSRDVEADPLAYTWTQVAGTAVVLDLADAARPAFVAPDVARDGETLTFRLVVHDGAVASVPVIVNVRVKDVNRVPIADAGAAQMVRGGSVATLDGRASYDPDGDPITYSWRQVTGTAVDLPTPSAAQVPFTAPLVSPAGETLTFEVTVSDGLASSSARTDVRVEGNHPPTADAGPDQVVEERATVVLNGAGSSDPDGDPLSYRWTQVGGPFVALTNDTTANPTFTAPLALPGSLQLVFRLVVGDGTADSAPDTVTITLRSALSPPNCSVAKASTEVLWPPDHRLVPISIVGVSSAPNDSVEIRIVRVTQDEPTNQKGDGNTDPDAFIQGATALVRAERAQNSNGRVYRIKFTAIGTTGSCTGAVMVSVPDNQGKGGKAIDDGQVYDATIGKR